MAARDRSRSGGGGEAVMDFYEVLDQVIDLLRSRGRVSYRALKRQYSLDDDYLEDLKVELIKSQQLAIDEDSEVLVWTGEAGALPEQPSTATEPTQPEITQKVQPPPPPEPPTPDAERRQLTVMFCDLADSTRFSC